MGLNYAVVTSVNRDDRKDGGAELFALTIETIRRRVPGCRVEVLVPDFQGSHDAMKIVMDARPDVLNHNTETVPRLYRQVRLGARYERSLEMLRYAKELAPGTPVKSGLMLGLGELNEEVLAVMGDLRGHGVRHPDARAVSADLHRSICRSCAMFRRLNSTNCGAKACGWAFRMWKPVRWCGVLIMRMIRMPQRVVDSAG